MTGIDLDAIQARADAAIEGPWFTVYSDYTDDVSIRQDEGPNPPYPGAYTEIAESHQSDDGVSPTSEFIAHSRTDIPALIAAVRERDATIARVRAVVDDWIDGRYGDDGYRVAPQPDDGHVLDHLRAAIDPQEGQ